MSREPPPLLLNLMCERLVEIYLRQSEQGRAAILGFLHNATDPDEIKVRFRIRRSGHVTLFLESAGTNDD